jgi:outer membrane lipoprotein-sorting protein
MRKCGFIIGILLLAVVANAQYPGFRLVADATAFKKEFASVSARTNTIKSDFVQEKNLSMLSEKIVSKGKFWFKKENAVRMEYTTPFQYLMVINGSKVYIKDNQKESRMSSRSNKLFQSMNKLLMDCARGTVFDNADFTVRLFEGTDQYLAELTPVSKEMKGFFKKINLVMKKKTYLVSKVQMYEPSGDTTTITYSNQELNTNLPDALFAVN